ncbi:Putative acetoacetyl-CoA reductase [Candidatus Fokinia solitaria]|uniref:Acetoacetyl-CoA reductase n=1 Tax=Candidatus Fokinia solitaria TaxID=1802984 RepID=A0A2U8BRP6_9RICK|nr:3-oxoacyl-ACP reductase [Candidatus Fokinia solitaria]AWD32940.1 Putative acetoacetyl-CoA reductase [Candidatus Fokinia solitaria]
MSRRVLITGGIKGLGKAIAKKFYESGYTVAVTYNSDKAAATAIEKSIVTKAFCWDVGNFEECQFHISAVEDYLGGNVEILINNAGITQDRMFHKTEHNDWESVLRTNLFSVFNMSRCVIQKMRDNKFGRIINISSVNANGMLGQTNYSASKAGIEGFTKALALENAALGITVNAIAPGYLGTDMVMHMKQEDLQRVVSKIPIGRLGTPEEIAEIAAFLAKNSTAFITGAVINANGGLRV